MESKSVGGTSGVRGTTRVTAGKTEESVASSELDYLFSIKEHYRLARVTEGSMLAVDRQCPNTWSSSL